METKELTKYPKIKENVIIFYNDEKGEQKSGIGHWDGENWLFKKYDSYEMYEVSGFEKEIIGWSYKNHSDTMEQVNHPAHYNSGKLECIDVMLDVFGAHDTIAFCKLNAFKYLFRAGKKADNSERQDLEKAEWYIKKTVELMKTNE